MLNILLHGIFDEKWCELWSDEWNSQNFNSLIWGGKLGWDVEVRY
jgi:hypothetical protein